MVFFFFSWSGLELTGSSMMDQRGRVQLRQVDVEEVRLPGRRQRLSLSVWFNKEPAELGRFVKKGEL